MLQYEKQASGSEKTKAPVETDKGKQAKKVGKGLTYEEGAAKLAPKEEKAGAEPKASAPKEAKPKGGKAKGAAQMAPAEVFKSSGYTDVDAKALSLYWGVDVAEVIDKVGAHLAEKGAKAAIDEYLRQAYTMYDPASDPEIAMKAFSKADVKLLADHFEMTVAEAQSSIEELLKMYGPEFVQAKIEEAKKGKKGKKGTS